MLRIHEIKLSLTGKKEELPDLVRKKLGDKRLKIKALQIVKESIDARDKENIKFVYSLDFDLAEGQDEEGRFQLEERLLKKCKGVKLERALNLTYEFVPQGSEKMNHRPVVAGFGPCGMFAALILAEMGYRPIVIERGKTMAERVKDVERFWQEGVLNPSSNVQFGEGGAGTFSDGKLTTQIKDPRIRKVLTELVEAGASPEILYKQKPHIGTDVLRRVVINIRKKIIDYGGEIHFESQLTGLRTKSCHDKNQLRGILINEKKEIETEHLILAVGHSARDTFRLLHEQGVQMEQKPFSIGVRIEHPQEIINESQYGKRWRDYNLGAAEYKLSHHCQEGRGVYTFCMCPGGQVVAAASEENRLVTNGMSLSSRAAANANSGLLVDVRREDFGSDEPLAGVAFQEKYEHLAFLAGGSNYRAPAQRVGNFMKAGQAAEASCQPSYRPGVTWTDLSICLPDFAVEAIREALPALGKKLKGFDHADAVLTGVETRSSSPVRILRDEELISNIRGLYPGGEGAGYAGGIVSAAVDGIKIAEEIGRKYRCCN